MVTRDGVLVFRNMDNGVNGVTVTCPFQLKRLIRSQKTSKLLRTSDSVKLLGSKEMVHFL